MGYFFLVDYDLIFGIILCKGWISFSGGPSKKTWFADLFLDKLIGYNYLYFLNWLLFQASNFLKF